MVYFIASTSLRHLDVTKTKMTLKSLFPSLLTLSLFGSCILTVPPRAVAQQATSPQLTAQTSSQLTEDKIRQTMAAIDKAEKYKDIEELLTFLAPFAVSEVTVEYEDTSITASLEGIDAHRDLLKKTFGLVKEREIINDYMSVRLTADGKLAIVTRIIVEVINTSDGKQFMAASNDTFRFAWLENQPTIVSTKSKGWLEEIPVAN